VANAVPDAPAQLPHYALRVRVRKGLRLVTGSSSVRFTPERATDRVVFRLWPNEPFLARKGGRLIVDSVRLDGRAAPTARPNATTLVLPRTLTTGQAVTIAMNWRLRLPVGSLDRLYGGTFARLGSFFPLLAWNSREGWETDPPSAFGWETWTSPTADFDVRVTAPSGMRVVATGERVGPGHWRADRVRDFALAAGRFLVVSGTTAAPKPVRLTVAVAPGSQTLARRLLVDARNALQAHAQRFGPYPWTTFTTVAFHMGPFSFEYPTLVFLSSDEPDLDSGLAHEIGHQWFYSLVGNNQARDPWLDEALATWAQARFTDELATFVGVSIPDDVRQKLGQPMSFWDRFPIPEFIEGVYSQGVQALASLGDPEAVDCALRAYVRDNAYRTATPDDLLAALSPFFPGARSKLEAYGAIF
jgi:aminopeptidase N